MVIVQAAVGGAVYFQNGNFQKSTLYYNEHHIEWCSRNRDKTPKRGDECVVGTEHELIKCNWGIKLPPKKYSNPLSFKEHQ